MKPTILITGANRGIGLELAAQFVRRGWHVFAGCRDSANAPQLQQLADRTNAVTLLEIDVRRDDQVAAAMEKIRSLAPSLDVLVNNAGVNPEPRSHTMMEIALGTVRDTFEVNTLGALRMLQAAFPLLLGGNNPRIVNITSGAGSLTKNSARSPAPAYCISKAALNLITRRAVNDLKPHGVSIVSVTPGWVQTEMGGPEAELSVRDAVSALAETIQRLTMARSGEWLNRHGQPSEYAW